jgi:hypothetical protein
MNKSEIKNHSNKFDPRLLSIYETLRCYRDSYSLPQRYDKALNYLIDMLEKDIYAFIPSQHNIDFVNDKFTVTQYYQEIL